MSNWGRFCLDILRNFGDKLPNSFFHCQTIDTTNDRWCLLLWYNEYIAINVKKHQQLFT